MSAALSDALKHPTRPAPAAARVSPRLAPHLPQPWTDVLDTLQHLKQHQTTESKEQSRALKIHPDFNSSAEA